MAGPTEPEPPSLIFWLVLRCPAVAVPARPGRLLVPGRRGRRTDRRRRPVSRRRLVPARMEGARAEGEEADDREQAPTPDRERRRLRLRRPPRLRPPHSPRLVPEHRRILARQPPPRHGRRPQPVAPTAAHPGAAAAAELRLSGQPLVTPRATHRTGHGAPPFSARVGWHAGAARVNYTPTAMPVTAGGAARRPAAAGPAGPAFWPAGVHPPRPAEARWRTGPRPSALSSAAQAPL